MDKEKRDLTFSEAQKVLDRQIEVYNQIQEQALRLVRILIAASVALITIISFADKQKVPNFRSHSYYVNSSVNQLGNEQFISTVSSYHTFFGVTLSAVGITLIGLTVINAIEGISAPQLEPGLADEEYKFQIHPKSGYKFGNYGGWIKHNNREISKARNKVEKAINCY